MKKPKSVPDPSILLDFPDHTAWISGCDTVRRNIFHDYTAGSDSDIVTYGDTRNYGDATSDPDIVPDSDRLRVFCEGVSFGRVDGMSGRVDTDIRGDEDIVTYGDLSFIQDSETIVCEEIFPYLYV